MLNVLNNLAALEAIRSKINTGQASSMVRLGDGEGLLLQYPLLKTRVEVDFILDFWFGRTRVSDTQIIELRALLIESIASSDILGVPSASQMRANSNWVYVHRFLSDNPELVTGKYLVEHEVHLWMQDQNIFPALLQGLDCVLISCRPVADDVKTHFGTSNVQQIIIPEEFKYAIDQSTVDQHYPRHFARVCSEIDALGRGRTYLIGAGVLGKYYAHRAKLAGSVAIDIGSVFDSWVNMRRRSSVRSHRAGF